MRTFIKILAVSLLFSALSAVSIPVTFAAGAVMPSPLEYQNKKVDELFPIDVVHRLDDSVKPLPTGDLKTDIIPKAIELFLMLVGTITFGVFVYAGVNLVIAQGNEEDITKFKNILIWSLAGLAFITVSYGLVSGIMQIAFK